jgi:hypothetical protein
LVWGFAPSFTRSTYHVFRDDSFGFKTHFHFSKINTREVEKCHLN